MFVFRKVYPFTWTVKVAQGVVPAFEFQARFESIGEDELGRIKNEDPTRADINVGRRVFKGWADGELVDEAGAPLAPTPENIAAILDLSFLRTPIVRAYFDAMSGLLAKN